ncbi:hypothetical protein ACFYZ8_08080 [Streptomyces sp. NPDC001668]
MDAAFGDPLDEHVRDVVRHGMPGARRQGRLLDRGESGEFTPPCLTRQPV